MANRKEPKEAGPAPNNPPGGAIRKASRDDGIAVILDPAAESREGVRVAIYGKTRMGKTTFALHLVDAMLARRICNTVIVHDPKYPDRQQYPGPAVTSPEQLEPTLEISPVVVCRPPFTAASAVAGVRGCVEDLGEPTALLLDESRRAVGKQQRWIDQDGPRNFEWLSLEAGGQGGSHIALVQMPRSMPADFTDSTTCDVVFCLQGKSLRYLVKSEVIPPEAIETVRKLPAGHFCVFSGESDWDGTVYHTPL